jgi:hypothetical protein
MKSFNAVFGLGSAFKFLPSVRSGNSVCRLLQGTGLLPSLWRARSSIDVTRNIRARSFSRKNVPYASTMLSMNGDCKRPKVYRSP